jgi:hypothetical protein
MAAYNPPNSTENKSNERQSDDGLSVDDELLESVLPYNFLRRLPVLWVEFRRSNVICAGVSRSLPGIITNN